MITRYGQPMIVLEYNHCLQKGKIKLKMTFKCRILDVVKNENINRCRGKMGSHTMHDASGYPMYIKTTPGPYNFRQLFNMANT